MLITLKNILAAPIEIVNWEIAHDQDYGRGKLVVLVVKLDHHHH